MYVRYKDRRKKYDKGKKKIPYFTRLHFKEGNIFFALYPTENGPMMYFEGKEYPLKKDLHIYLKKVGKKREFLSEIEQLEKIGLLKEIK